MRCAGQRRPYMFVSLIRCLYEKFFFRYAILASAFLLPGGSVLADTLLTSDVYMSASTADDVVQQLKTRYKTSRVAARFHNKLKYFEVSATYTDGTGVTFLCNAGGEELLKMPSGTEYNVFVRGGKLHFRTAQLMVNTDCHIVHDFTDTFQHIMDADARWTCVNDYGSLDKNRASLLDAGGNTVIPTGRYESIRIRQTDSGLKYIIVYGPDMQQQGLYDYNGRKLLDAQYKLITVAADGQVRSYSDAVGAQAVVHDVRVCRPASVTTGQVVAAATAQTGGAQVRTQQTIGHAADKGSSLSGSSGGFGGGMQRADDGVLSDADKALQKQAEFNRETDELMRQMDEQIAWARILGIRKSLSKKISSYRRHVISTLH